MSQTREQKRRKLAGQNEQVPPNMIKINPSHLPEQITNQATFKNISTEEINAVVMGKGPHISKRRLGELKRKNGTSLCKTVRIPKHLFDTRTVRNREYVLGDIVSRQPIPLEHLIIKETIVISDSDDE